jgi:release factor glutamine methyltransferase
MNPEAAPAPKNFSTGPAGGQGWTIKRILDWAADYFNKQNIENPHLEAEILLAHALNLKRIDLYVKFEKELDQNELSRFKECVIRRKNHEPTAYITGIKSFMSLDLIVSRLVLIPRPETELLVEAAIDIAKHIEHPSILDIGTGSGAIAVSLAKYVKHSRIIATDISRGVTLIALENAKKHGVMDSITFEVADLFPKEAEKFDLIVSNPPYIRSGDIKDLAPEIRDFEPHVAYDGGPDGLDHYRKILDKAGEFIKPNGYLLFEVGEGQAKEVVNLIRSAFASAEIVTKKDLNGIERVIIAKS